MKSSRPELARLNKETGKVQFFPHDGQWEAWEAEERFIGVIAGTQSGKTSFGPHWLYREIQRCGPGDYMMVGPTLELFKRKALPEFKKVFERWLKLGKWNASDKVFTFSEEGCLRAFGEYNPDVPTVIFLGHAGNPNSLESATAKAVWCDEVGQPDFKQESWEALLRRLSLGEGRALLTTTPYNLGWLKELVFDRWKRRGTEQEQEGDSDYFVINFDSTTNPQFSSKEFERARRDMQPWRFDLFYRGIFTRPAGQIYDCFEDKYDAQQHPHVGPIYGHKCKPFLVPDAWPRIVSGDFGNVNTALGLWAENPATRPPGGKVYSGRCYLLKEYKAGNRTARQHLTAFLGWKYDDAGKHIPGTGENVKLAVGGAKSEDGWRKEYTDAGLMMVEPPVSDVEVGINNLYGMMKRGEVLFFDTCDKILADIASYSRELTPTGEPTEKIENKETFHFCFVPGTLIDTSEGQKPIECVRAGDLVHTRQGLKRVLIAQQTDDNADVKTVTFSDGRTITATGNHPVWVKGKGFVAIDMLRYGDTIEVSQVSETIQCLQLKTEKSSRFRELTTTAILTLKDLLTVVTSNTLASTITAFCGNFTTALSPQITISTILTATHSTTIFPTWNAFRLPCTYRDTTKENHLLPIKDSCSQSENWRLIGTNLKKVVNGIAKWRKTYGVNELSTTRYATNAANVSKPLATTGQTGSVPTLANQTIGVKAALIMLRESAPSVRVRSLSTDTQKQSHVAAHAPKVLGVKNAGKSPVYNLTVADAHEYFANGVLVSNCDMARYFAAYVRFKPETPIGYRVADVLHSTKYSK